MSPASQFTAQLNFHFDGKSCGRRTWFMFGDDCHRRVPMEMEGVQGLNTVGMWTDAPGTFHQGESVTVRCVVIAPELYVDAVQPGVRFKLWDGGFFAIGVVLERGAMTAWLPAKQP